MNERSSLIEWVRGELVGPNRPLSAPTIIEFSDRVFSDPLALRNGPLAWRPKSDNTPQEILYFMNETPHRKYGAGVLHPDSGAAPAAGADEAAAKAADTIGAEQVEEVDLEDIPGMHQAGEEDRDKAEKADDETDDFEVTSADIRHPSTMGVSFCVRLNDTGKLLIRLPQERQFSWQKEGTKPFEVNGRYEECVRRWKNKDGAETDTHIWRRLPALLPGTQVAVLHSEMVSRQVIRKKVALEPGSPLNLIIDVFPRKLQTNKNVWLVTVVLRNISGQLGSGSLREAVLYQSYFEVTVSEGKFEKYPESQRRFEQLDPDEQSLALLYRESATWGIGHGCAAGWDADYGQTPAIIYADVMPAVELPSMTPDIEINGSPIRLSMRDLSNLSDDGSGHVWKSLNDLVEGYEAWLQQRSVEITSLDADYAGVAARHIKSCEDCLNRIKAGVERLKTDSKSRQAFRLANLAMLLQQISTKQLFKRHLEWHESSRTVRPQGEHQSPWSIYQNDLVDRSKLGSWRAFQVAFLLMSLEGICDEKSPDREIVDLVWFPTGGGKTEAYLAVMAFYMFRERFEPEGGDGAHRRDGTNVLMRYTLRMLTTQQFQRAASLICSMEYLRRHSDELGIQRIRGGRFSLGLWIGGDGSPNRIKEAEAAVTKYRRSSEQYEGNPLVLTECPWCRAEIGRYDGQKPRMAPELSATEWNSRRVRGIVDSNDGPRLLCPDRACEYGQEQEDTWLPVEVIDERIYQQPPSLVIGTADKLAMIAYRPSAGVLFGRRKINDKIVQAAIPPGLIIQDELHLISGPLGTMYALYEGLFERLCSYKKDNKWIKPKIIASTATIRGADDQVKALYNRNSIQLFPSPGLKMGDSFFGKHARDENGKLRDGRLYLGVHASDYGSILTAQVRAFAAALFRPWFFAAENRDPWWTLLAFYNSIRELGGARTLFDSDIRSRLKFMFNREGFAPDNRRNLPIVEELTSRLSQAGIVQMMDRLSAPYDESGKRLTVDACLASSIIEVGVDIERLSLMGVVGQPKTTATYIQVTGRVGRRWWERPGLILMIYSPSKSRDRSHFEQFHSYHRRLYERVEPTTATPFAISAIDRGLSGALIAWARQHASASVRDLAAYRDSVESGYQLLRQRCESIQIPEDRERSLYELEIVRDDLIRKWEQNPQYWEEFPPRVDGEYLMLWPGQFASALQKRQGVFVPSSMRQVDGTAELKITQGYAAAMGQRTVGSGNGPGNNNTK